MVAIPMKQLFYIISMKNPQLQEHKHNYEFWFAKIFFLFLNLFFCDYIAVADATISRLLFK